MDNFKSRLNLDMYDPVPTPPKPQVVIETVDVPRPDLSVIETYDTSNMLIEHSATKKREPPVTVAVNHSFKVAAKAYQRVSDTKTAIEEYKRDGNANYRSKQLNVNDIRADERHAAMEHLKYDVSRPIIARWMTARKAAKDKGK